MVNLRGLLTGALAAQNERETCVQQTGFFYNDDATEGYTLFAPVRGIGTYLVDTQGQVVQKWMDPDGYTAGVSAYVSQKGTLLKKVRNDGGGGFGERLREYDETGNCIWEFIYDNAKDPPAKGVLHHDFVEMPNGNLLVMAREGPNDSILEIDRTKGETNLGYNPRKEYFSSPWPTNVTNTCEKILDGAAPDFEAEWYWSSADHRGESPTTFSPTNMGTINFNHIDYFPDRDHILISCNTCNEIYIIDHDENAASDELLWRYGKPSNYGVAGATQMLSFNHGAHWVYDKNVYGWKGYDKDTIGDVIVFNNRDPALGGPGRTGFSSIVVVSPVYDKQANNYGVVNSDGVFTPTQPKSYYTEFSRNGDIFQMDSDATGSTQLLPNGNVMLAMGTANNNPSTGSVEFGGAEGDIYELQPVSGDGNTLVAVWRYVNPFVPPRPWWNSGDINTNNGPKDEDIELNKCEPVELCDQTVNLGTDCNIIFRAVKYSPKHKGVKTLLKLPDDDDDDDDDE